MAEDGITHSSSRRPRLLSILCGLLNKVVTRNNVTTSTKMEMTVFHGSTAPSISIDRYLERIFKYADCSPSCFLVAYVYIDRFIHLHPGIPITGLNVHRLLITSILLAVKFLDDRYYSNAHFAKIGGVTTQEMNRLEIEFLFRLNFGLQVTTSVFQKYCAQLEVPSPSRLQLASCGILSSSSSSSSSSSDSPAAATASAVHSKDIKNLITCYD